jgi:hypothetical protein
VAAPVTAGTVFACTALFSLSMLDSFLTHLTQAKKEHKSGTIPFVDHPPAPASGAGVAAPVTAGTVFACTKLCSLSNVFLNHLTQAKEEHESGTSSNEEGKGRKPTTIQIQVLLFHTKSAECG